jgi:predicted O-methyltransferase YrrM
MPGFSGLANNLRLAAKGPRSWWLSRQSIVSHGAIQHLDELAEFIRIIRMQPLRRVMEIGTAQGGVFWLLCQLSAPDATLISVDLPPGERNSGGLPVEVDLKRMARLEQTVHIVSGNSHQDSVRGHIAKLLRGASLDLLFIDGDHNYEGVRQDYEVYRSFVRRGGLIAFHDIVQTPWPGCNVDRLWSELAQDQTMSPKTIIGKTGSMFGGIGLLTV